MAVALFFEINKTKIKSRMLIAQENAGAGSISKGFVACESLLILMQSRCNLLRFDCTDIIFR